MNGEANSLKKKHSSAIEALPRTTEPQKIPLVMSADETKRLLAVASSLKARVLLSLGYG